MMVTVAKSLDVPIKLMFPRPASPDDPTATPSHAMLGLGDVVLPGIMIGLALRFDLYLFYLRRQKRTPATKEGEADTVKKAQYHSLAGRWSDHFWTHSLTGRPLWTTTTTHDGITEAPFTFPKTYFRASLVGYVLGLFATVGVMMVWNHAQPALLYLVPGVLGSLWLTALVRGELNLMWNYTEEIEEEDKTKKTPDEQKALTDDKADESPSGEDATATAKAKETTDTVKRVVSHRPQRELFSFSIEAPWDLKQPHSVRKASQADKSANATAQNGEKHNWAPSKKSTADVEPAGKRVRLN
jgi:minor histocompatibility antigen H13